MAPNTGSKQMAGKGQIVKAFFRTANPRLGARVLACHWMSHKSLMFVRKHAWTRLFVRKCENLRTNIGVHP
jgi:hypothetical protein